MDKFELVKMARNQRDRIKELEAENAELRKAIKYEQTLREEYHNEEAARLRHALSGVVRYAGNAGDDYLADKARQALEINKHVDDKPQE